MSKKQVPQLPLVRPVTEPNFKEKVRRHQALGKARQARAKVDAARTRIIEVNAMLSELGGTDSAAILAILPVRDALDNLTRELSLVIADRQEAFDAIREPGNVVL